MKSFFKIPNIITLLNLLCGCIAIYHISNNSMFTGTYFIIAAAFLDFFDGLAARLLNQASEIGKQLDSLADVISFGLAPGFIFFQLLGASGHEWSGDFFDLNMFAFLLPAFGALRLAKFNIDDSQSDNFKGLPTPAMAMYAIGMVYWQETDIYAIFFSTEVLIIQILILSFLMISSQKLIALKFSNKKIANNIDVILLMAVSILLFLFFKLSALPLIIVSYIIISILSFNFKLFNKK